MPVAVDAQEGFLQQVLTPTGVAEETVEVVHQALGVAFHQDVERLDGARLELLHQVLVAHLLQQRQTVLLLRFLRTRTLGLFDDAGSMQHGRVCRVWFGIKILQTHQYIRF